MNSPVRILIVDDDQNMVKSLAFVMKYKGYDVQTASFALQALRMLGETSYDLVISDIKMPEMTGVELLRAIKMRYPQTPVVLMTAYSAAAIVQQALDEGVLEVLPKPMDLDYVLGSIPAWATVRS